MPVLKGVPDGIISGVPWCCGAIADFDGMFISTHGKPNTGYIFSRSWHPEFTHLVGEIHLWSNPKKWNLTEPFKQVPLRDFGSGYAHFGGLSSFTMHYLTIPIIGPFPYVAHDLTKNLEQSIQLTKHQHTFAILNQDQAVIYEYELLSRGFKVVDRVINPNSSKGIMLYMRSPA